MLSKTDGKPINTIGEPENASVVVQIFVSTACVTIKPDDMFSL